MDGQLLSAYTGLVIMAWIGSGGDALFERFFESLFNLSKAALVSSVVVNLSVQSSVLNSGFARLMDG